MKKRLKILLGFLILGVTIVAFVHYAANHPELLRKLRDISIGQLALLLALYAVWFFALVLVMRISLRMYSIRMGRQENFLLNAYSSLINFFGPGQSGPAFRGLYLKKRHGMRIKDYIFTTLLYYGFYAVLSAFLLFVGSRPWWQTALLVLLAGGGSAIVIGWYHKRSAVKDAQGMTPFNLTWLFLATALQMAAQVAIYFVELRSTAPGTSFAQVLTYTGAANFALFVALTPGAIGIRESFLFFSQQLHHISNAAIIAANVIDRAVYLVFLGLLFVAVLSMHAREKLRLNQLKTEES